MSNSFSNFHVEPNDSGNWLVVCHDDLANVNRCLYMAFTQRIVAMEWARKYESGAKDRSHIPQWPIHTPKQ